MIFPPFLGNVCLAGALMGELLGDVGVAAAVVLGQRLLHNNAPFGWSVVCFPFLDYIISHPREKVKSFFDFLCFAQRVY